MKLKDIIPLTEASLSVPQLSGHARYDYRVDILINKINKGEDFETVDGKKIKIKKQPPLLKVLKARDFTAFKDEFKSEFTTTTGDKIKITKLKKTADFGGEASGKRLSKEDFAIGELNKMIKAVLKETGQKTLDIKVGSKVYKNVSGAASTPGTPKSDFHLVADGKPVVWISHKAGKSPKDFQQWGGVTDPNIKEHKEVKEFAEAIKKELKKQKLDEFPKNQTWGRKLKSPNLRKMAIYGHDYTPSAPLGKNNVTILIQGKVDLVQKGKHYELSGDIVHHSGDSMMGGYVPYFTVRYSSDRKNFGIKGARVAINTKAGRKVHKEI